MYSMISKGRTTCWKNKNNTNNFNIKDYLNTILYKVSEKKILFTYLMKFEAHINNNVLP